MKAKYLLLITYFLLGLSLMAQEKKPTLMILPSDNWCEARYYMTSFKDVGTTKKTPNYQQAFTEDAELPLVISKIGGLLTSIGYSLKDAEMETKAVYARMAEDDLTSSKDGSLIDESPLDMIKRKAKMDILIQIWWDVNREANGKSVSFILEAFDSYTSKRLATASGISEVSNNSVPVMLEKAIKGYIKPFDKQLDAYFKDTRINGREIVLNVRVWDSWDNDLETEYNGKELIEIIQDWLHEHAVKGVFNLSDGSERFAQFEQLRIPLEDDKGRALDARGFVSGLRKYLAESPYNIPSKIMLRGLGEANLIIGEK